MTFLLTNIFSNGEIKEAEDLYTINLQWLQIIKGYISLSVIKVSSITEKLDSFEILIE